MNLRRVSIGFLTLLTAECGLLFSVSSYSADTFRIKDGQLIDLGKIIFRSKLLSKTGDVSCSSCHVPSLGFSGDRSSGFRDGRFLSARHAPTLFGLSRDGPFTWDGRTTDLIQQISVPLESSEMQVQWETAIPLLQEQSEVKFIMEQTEITSFGKSFIIKSLEAYIISISRHKSRFDKFFFEKDLNALSGREKEGFRLFVRKAGCASCHLINSHTRDFTDRSFHNTGTAFGTHDLGRAAVTAKKEDDHKFKTPSLRGVAMRTAFMHDGSMKSLEEVLLHYNTLRKTGEDQKIDSRLEQLFLTNKEIEDLISFLETLTPEQSMD